MLPGCEVLHSATALKRVIQSSSEHRAMDLTCCALTVLGLMTYFNYRSFDLIMR